MAAKDSRCRNCRQPIVWAKSMSRDSWIPLDTSPDPGMGSARKRFVYENGPNERPTVYAEVLTGQALHAAIANAEQLWILHRESCSANRPHNPKPAHVQLNLPNRSRRMENR